MMLEKQAADTLDRAAKIKNNKTRNPGGERNHKTQCSEVTLYSGCVNSRYGGKEKWGDHRFSLSPPFPLEFPTQCLLNLIALDMGSAGGVCGLTSNLAPPL